MTTPRKPRSRTEPKAEDCPSFEAALTELEKIVEDLEGGEPELSAALTKFEAGVRLLNHCHGVLDKAERSVAILTGVDEDGQPQTAPFDAAATIHSPDALNGSAQDTKA